jgi:hypothetical protein
MVGWLVGDPDIILFMIKGWRIFQQKKNRFRFNNKLKKSNNFREGHSENYA